MLGGELIEYRTATPLGVRHEHREIELIAIPYNETARVFRRRQQRWVDESVDPEAFAGVTGKVSVNRAHDVERPLGWVSKMQPGDPRGLRSLLRIARTPAGDEALELADEGLLSASVGFMAIGEQWSSDRATVKVTKARLAHIALTGDPAYAGAEVLAVRSGEGVLLDAGVQRVPTPNLDQLLLEMRVERARS